MARTAYYSRKKRGVCVSCGKPKQDLFELSCRKCLGLARGREKMAAARRAKAQPIVYLGASSGLLEAPEPPAERPVYVFNRREDSLQHLRAADD